MTNKEERQWSRRLDRSWEAVRQRNLERRNLDDGSAARRAGRGVLSGALACRKPAKRFNGGVLDIIWDGGSAAKRVGGGVLNITLAGGSAVKRVGGGVLNRS